MTQTTIDELFPGPWGIVESRRRDIEDGSSGAFDRIYKEEVSRHFLPIGKIAEAMACHEGTARKWLRDAKARFIMDGLGHLYFQPDVEKVMIPRRAKLAADDARKVAKAKKAKAA